MKTRRRKSALGERLCHRLATVVVGGAGSDGLAQGVVGAEDLVLLLSFPILGIACNSLETQLLSFST
jgi:hypothetical protein